MALVLNALFVVHLLLERTALRPFVIYIPILGGILELGMVYLVWIAVLEAWRRSRPLRQEPWLWLAALISLLPPAVSSVCLLRGGQP
jgi:serine/threonine-protein kinase